MNPCPEDGFLSRIETLRLKMSTADSLTNLSHISSHRRNMRNEILLTYIYFYTINIKDEEEDNNIKKFGELKIAKKNE